MLQNFEQLTPDRVLEAVEAALGEKLSGVLSPLPSYINRVYELQTWDGQPLIAKFYRPGRWTIDQLYDERDFVLDCADAEIPVIPPMTLADHDTIGEHDGIYFAVFPKRSGREMELNTDAAWRRLGSVLGRMHLVGSECDAEHRIVLHPEESLANDVAELCEVLPKRLVPELKKVRDLIINEYGPIFDDIEPIRIHGDCHRANIIERPGEGLMVIDFDDMMMGPPVQDLWLLLPGHAHDVTRELDLILEGYEQFLAFDDHSLKLIEPLRAMRMIYFLAWQKRQLQDPRFQQLNPEWGSDRFWEQELRDLEHQLHMIGRSSHL